MLRYLSASLALGLDSQSRMGVNACTHPAAAAAAEADRRIHLRLRTDPAAGSSSAAVREKRLRRDQRPSRAGKAKRRRHREVCRSLAWPRRRRPERRRVWRRDCARTWFLRQYGPLYLRAKAGARRTWSQGGARSRDRGTGAATNGVFGAVAHLPHGSFLLGVGALDVLVRECSEGREGSKEVTAGSDEATRRCSCTASLAREGALRPHEMAVWPPQSVGRSFYARYSTYSKVGSLSYPGRHLRGGPKTFLEV